MLGGPPRLVPGEARIRSFLRKRSQNCNAETMTTTRTTTTTAAFTTSDHKMRSESKDESNICSGDSLLGLDSEDDTSSSYQAHSECPSSIEGISTPCQDEMWPDEKENT